MLNRSQKKEVGVEFRIRLTCLTLLCFITACGQSSGPAAQFVVVHPESDSATPLSPTAAFYNFQEDYAYNSDCLASLVHTCAIETIIPVGETVVGRCTLDSSDVADNSCLPVTVKNTILAAKVPSILVTRIEDNRYRITLTITQGHREVFEVSDLSALNLSQSDKEVSSL